MVSWIVGGLLLVAMLGLLVRLEGKARRSLAHSASLPEADRYPPISVIKPVYGSDDFTEKNFRSWVEQEYAGPVQLIFSFQDPDDPALPLAREIASQADVQVLVNPVTPGYSGKMSNLLHGLERADHEFIVFSDSDILARPNLLRQLVALRQQGFDLTSCLMRHLHAHNVWGRIYAAFWNFEHMAFIAPAILRRGRDATGGTMAMDRDTLAQMGGLDAFKDYVAEDVAMGRKAHELGLRVGLGPIVDSPVSAMSLSALVNKFARAALFGASMNDLGETLPYALLFSYLIVLPVGALLGDPVLLGTGLAQALLRVLFASRFWGYATGERRIFRDILLSDIIFLIAFGRALLTRRLVWGGIPYRVLPGGRLVRVEDQEETIA